MPQPTLRDFRYLDIDRVRSLLSQAAQGYPDTFASVQERTGQLGLKAVFELAGQQKDSATESRAAHHYQYTLLEDLLRDSGRLLEFNGTSSMSALATLADGQVVRATGRIQLTDPRKIGAVLTNIGRLMRVAQKASQSTRPPGTRANSPTKDDVLKQQNVTEKLLQDMAWTFETILGDRERLRLYPWPTSRDAYIAGTLEREYGAAEDEAVFATGALDLSGDWTVVGIVTRLELAASDAADGSLESMAKAMVAALGGLNQLVAPISASAVFVTPLAVYREI